MTANKSMNDSLCPFDTNKMAQVQNAPLRRTCIKSGVSGSWRSIQSVMNLVGYILIMFYVANMLIIIDDDSKKQKKVFKRIRSANYKDFGRDCPTGNCTARSSIDNVSVCYWTHNDVQRQRI